MWLWSLDDECIPEPRPPNHPWRNLLPCCGANSYSLISYHPAPWCYLAAVFFSFFPTLTWHFVSRLWLVEEGGQWVYGLRQSSHLYMVVHIFLPLICTMVNQVSKNFSPSLHLRYLVYITSVYFYSISTAVTLTLPFCRFLCHREHLCQLYYS